MKGARVADVARRHDVTRQHICQWRSEFRRRGESLTDETGFLPVEITAAHTVTAASAVLTTVELALANGRRLRGIDGLSASGLAQLIRVLDSA